MSLQTTRLFEDRSMAQLHEPVRTTPGPRPDTKPNESILPVVAILLAVILWGGSFAAMRVTLKALSPWTVMWIRMMTAVVILIPLAGKLRLHGYRSGDWRLLVPMALLQPCFYFLLESNALRLTTSSQAGVIAASVPLMVSVGAWLFLNERLVRHTLVGLSMAMAGVVMLTLLNHPGGKAANPILGNLMEMGAMICAAANMILVKQLSRRYSPWTLTALQVAAGAIFFLPGLWFLLHVPATAWTLPVVLSLLFLGGLVTLGAFGLYNWGMSRIAASRASVFINLVPVFAVAIGWGLLGESLSPAQSLAAAVVICGVYFSQRD
jgi:drug/metabolite transporter (DMT)-like permease